MVIPLALLNFPITMNAANKLLGVQLINVLGLIGNRHCHTIIPDINIHPHVSQGTRYTVFLCVHVSRVSTGTRRSCFQGTRCNVSFGTFASQLVFLFSTQFVFLTVHVFLCIYCVSV